MFRKSVGALIQITFLAGLAVGAGLRVPAINTKAAAPGWPSLQLETAKSAATFALAADLFKNAGGNYNIIASPDLQIRQYLFPPANNKALRVHVVNTGNAAAGACRLLLTVRKINGVAVGRTTHVNVPVLAAGKDLWLHIDAKGILPKNISLESTTFKLNVDATEIVNELDESNNEVWHNL